MKTQKQFILDTLLPYKQNPETRSIRKEGLGCFYLSPEGNKCAVGKHLIKGEWQNFGHYYNDLIEKYDKKDIFTKEALNQNLSDNVWSRMQVYHDQFNDYQTANNAIKTIEKELNINLEELYL